MTDSAPLQPVFQEQPPQVIKRNFLLAVLNGVLYVFAETLFDPTLVVTSLASRLTTSAFLLGLFAPISNAGWYLPQFFFSSLIQNQPRKVVVYQRMSFIRIACWALLAASVNLVRNPDWILISLILTYSIASLASGIGGLPFLEVVSKTIPPQRRGELFAWRLGLGGLMGIAGSVLVRWMLDPASPLPFPNNYGLLAIGLFVFASASLVLFNRIEELPDTQSLPRRKISEQFSIALRIVRNSRNYRLHLLIQAFLFIAISATPFYAVYVTQKLGGPREYIGYYLGVLMAANLLSNLVFGWLSRKVGNQKILVFGTLAGLLVSLLVLTLVLFGKSLHVSPALAGAWLFPVFFLQGVRVTAVGVSSPGMMLNIIPPAERSLMIGFTQTFAGVVVLFTMTTGLLADVFGYPAIMVISALAYLAAFLLAVRIRENPDRMST